jgi:RecA/RadA recombinase
MKNKEKKLKQKLKGKEEYKPKAKDYLSTGSTLLNLAITGYPNRGYLKGHYYSLTGDSRSGKTWLALSALAEAAVNKNFENYRLIYDDVEHGALMDKQKYFGNALIKRLEEPDKGQSVMLEDFYFNVQNALDKGKPFIYVIDSMDTLTTEQEIKKFHKRKKAREKKKETDGSMTDGKAKINSQTLRLILTPLFDSRSILILIHQTRERMGFGAQYSPKTRGGGQAPGFYAGIELWSKVVGTIKKTVKGKPRQVGTSCEIQTKKNRLQGKDRKVIVPILWSMGIDDVGACVDYLVDEKRWSKNDSTINAKDLDIKGSRKKIIRYIEKNDMERDVREYVADTWEEIEEACEEKNRKPRYV